MKGTLLCLTFLLIPVISVSQTSDDRSATSAPEAKSATVTSTEQPSTPGPEKQTAAASPAEQTPVPDKQPALTTSKPPEQASDSSNFTLAKGFVLEDSVPVKLRINRTISSGDSHVGDTVDFEVLQDVSVNGTLVIPKGGLAYATVTEAQAKRRMARGGKLGVNIDYVKLVSSEKAPLRAVKELKGGGHTGAMTAGIVATGIVFFPAAPFFLFMHGKDITIPKGTEITAYVNGDMKLDIAKFQQSPPHTLSAQSSQAAVNSGTTRLQLESNPSGADIEIDGNFVGNTPSDVQVSEGAHAVTVKKAGFKDWTRKLTVTAGGSVHLGAELEKTDAP